MPIVQPDNTQYAGGYLPAGNQVAARNDRAGSTNTYTADGEVVGMGMHRPRPNEPSMTLDDVDERHRTEHPVATASGVPIPRPGYADETTTSPVDAAPKAGLGSRLEGSLMKVTGKIIGSERLKEDGQALKEGQYVPSATYEAKT